MKTKFIGLDGFGEIETLKTTRKVKKHYVKKTVRCFKEAVQTASCFMQSFNNTNQKASQKTPTLDACYRNARMGNKSEYSVKILDFAKYSNKQPSKKAYSVKYKREFQPISKNFLKNKAAFGAMTACITGVFAVMAIFPVAGVNASASVSEQTTGYALSENATNPQAHTLTNVFGNKESDTNISAFSSENINTGIVGLYIDGEFLGAVIEEYALYQGLEEYINEVKADYDSNTTVEYANNIEVTSGNFEGKDILSINELLEKAKKILDIAVTTDVVSEREIPYETETQYDDTETTDYREVTQNGKNGVESVTYRAKFVNGEEVESVEVSSKVITEPVKEIVTEGTAESTTGTFAWPVPNTHNVTSYYGYRWGTIHAGIDISNGVTDEAIVASDSGTVTWAGWDDSGYGYYVIIDHGNGYSTLYGHCNSVYVSQGEYVSQGQTIAGMGNTGFSTGTHLHFEIRNGSEKLDPMEFFN